MNPSWDSGWNSSRTSGANIGECADASAVFNGMEEFQQPGTDPRDRSFGEWGSFNDCDEFADGSSPTEIMTPRDTSNTDAHSKQVLETKLQTEDVRVTSYGQVLQACFPLPLCSVSAAEIHWEPGLLSDLLEPSPGESPSDAPAQLPCCDGATLWSCVQGDLRTLVPTDHWTHSRSHRSLLAALRVSPGGESPAPVEEESLESSRESSSPSSKELIQTKLLGPSCSPNAPHFLYQISQQWLTRQHLQLHVHSNKKGYLF
ncbi:uncharacterized protein LOC136716761 [Amia ocellicauda]|uniref:uncharacterized protein LOC136716761 n=1 Tax=Amia ocellicauda TaxID=2972642 RepID=UPI003463F9DC